MHRWIDEIVITTKSDSYGSVKTKTSSEKRISEIFLYQIDINVNKFEREVPVDSVHMYA